MQAIFAFSIILLVMTIFIKKYMTKEVPEDTSCPNEANSVKKNWSYFYIFLIISIVGIIIGGIGTIVGLL